MLGKQINNFSCYFSKFLATCLYFYKLIKITLTLSFKLLQNFIQTFNALRAALFYANSQVHFAYNLQITDHHFAAIQFRLV